MKHHIRFALLFSCWALISFRAISDERAPVDLLPLPTQESLREHYESNGLDGLLDNALVIWRSWEQRYSRDIQYLRSSVLDSWNGEWIDIAAERLEDDQKRLEVFFSEIQKLPADQRGDPDLRSSLARAVGYSSQGVAYTGLLTDAAKELRDFGREFVELDLSRDRSNRRTVQQVALFYLCSVAKNAQGTTMALASEECSRNLQTLYVAEFPLGLREALQGKFSAVEAQTLLVRSAHFLVFHSGYVFGGKVPAPVELVRGYDCSALVCHAGGTGARYSTMVLDFAMREERGDVFSTDEHSVLIELREKWALDLAGKEFNEVQAPQPGDVVLWRVTQDNGSVSRHVAVFVEWDGKDRAVVLDLNRQDDKSQEGFAMQSRSVLRDDAEVFFLRRVYR